MAALDVWSWIKSLSRAHARDSTRQLGHSVIYVFLEEWKSLEDLGVQDRTINRFILKKLFFGKNELGYQWWGVKAHQWVTPAPSQPFNRFFFFLHKSCFVLCLASHRQLFKHLLAPHKHQLCQFKQWYSHVDQQLRPLCLLDATTFQLLLCVQM